MYNAVELKEYIFFHIMQAADDEARHQSYIFTFSVHLQKNPIINYWHVTMFILQYLHSQCIYRKKNKKNPIVSYWDVMLFILQYLHSQCIYRKKPTCIMNIKM